MKSDDGVRSKKGVVICLRDMGNGNSRFFIDDVCADQGGFPVSWSANAFYTFTPEFDNTSLESMELSADQFEQIGIAVVARLVALTGRSL